jgi:hypothetical protein
MIWSKEAIQDLSEKDLYLKFLIPLFTAMGYQGVRYYHGKEEQGKDIVMWKFDEFRGRINYGVVVGDSPPVSLIPEGGAFHVKFKNWPKSSLAQESDSQPE